MHNIHSTYLNVLPALVPIPSLDGHVIASGKDDTRRRVNSQAANVVRVRLERRNFFVCVVVKYTQLEVVRASDEPVLARDEFDTSHRNFSDFECLDYRACFMIINVDGAVVKSSQEPWLRWVKIDTLDAV